MPLFGSKKHANETVTGTGTTGLGHNTHAAAAPIHTSQPGGAMNQNTDLSYAGQPGFQSGTAGNNMGGPMSTHMGGNGPMGTSQLNGDPYMASGTGTHTLGHNDRAHIPPTNQLDGSHGGSSHPSGHTSVTGKIESAIGSAVGSSALKAKGDLKQQEANAIRMQGAELSEAERLEREAVMRRERAVGHGAHPINATLGGGHTGQSPAGVGPFNNNM